MVVITLPKNPKKLSPFSPLPLRDTARAWKRLHDLNQHIRKQWKAKENVRTLLRRERR